VKVVAVLAHPGQESFNRAIFDTAVAALRASGHDVVALDLYADGFDPVMTREERAAYHGEQPLTCELTQRYADEVRSAQALVFVYPTWWSSVPAILKGWLEKVMVPGVSFVFDEHHRVRRGLTNVTRIVGISTYAAPRSTVRLINDNGRRTVVRALRLCTGMRTRAKWLALYKLPSTSDHDRAAFLRRVERTMAAL
jgi:putative NADPH-quinone reductase